MKAILILENHRFIEVESFGFRPGKTTTRLIDTLGGGSIQHHPITRNVTNDQCGFVTNHVLPPGTQGIAATDSGFQYYFRVEESEPQGGKYFYVGTVTRPESLAREMFDQLYAKHILKQAPEEPK